MTLGNAALAALLLSFLALNACAGRDPRLGADNKEAILPPVAFGGGA